MENELEKKLNPQTIAVLGVPSSAGARQPGQERAPEAIRRTGLMERLRNAGIDCNDLGDLPLIRYEPDLKHPKCQNLALVSAVARQVSDRVAAAVQAHHKFLVLGGDCTITVGVLAGLRRHISHPGMIYLDGDIDMNTPDDTSSGVLDGMVLAHITGQVVNELSQTGFSAPLLPEDRIVVFGHNPDSGWIDPGEKIRFEQSSIIKFPVGQIRDSIPENALTARRLLEEKVTSYLVHFDTDVIDESDWPAADVPHRKGLCFSDTKTALRIFWSAPKCAGLVVTEFNPNRDPDGLFAIRLADLLAETINGKA